MLTPSQVTKGYLAIMDGEYMDYVFTFPINPKEIRDNHQPKFADHAVIGRGHPRSHYTAGGPRTISFSLDFDAKNEMFCVQRAGVIRMGVPDYMPPLGTTFLQHLTLADGETVVSSDGRTSRASPVDRLENSIRFLQALTYPREFQRQRGNLGELFTGPPMLLFVYGKKRIRCYLREAAVTEREWNKDLRVLRASVDIELQEQPERPVSFQSYLHGRDDSTAVDVRSI